MTTTVSADPAARSPSATVSPYSHPEHAAERSNAAARVAPSAACTSTAVEGSNRSGVAVLRMIVSTSPALTEARSIALRAASTAMEQVDSPSRAIRRSWIPDRSTIHSCVVSIPRAAKS